jgi:dTMP kinase
MPKADCLSTSGVFISFEGGEGSGKSTQAQRLAARLRRLGRDVVVTREPGGSPFAEKVRELILDPATPAHAPLSEALLFYAARADHLDSVIRPALARGSIVLCDRFSDSTEVYQCHAGGLSQAAFKAIEAAVVGETRPNLTLVLDLDAALGLERARARGALNSYDARSADFHERLRQGFRAIARREPDRCALIDASAGPDTVAEAIWSIVARRLGITAVGA